MRPLLALALFAAACTNDPVYIPGPMNLEAGMGGMQSDAAASLPLPINLETPDDATARNIRMTELGVNVPYVKLGDIELSVEWTVKSLDPDGEGIARVQLNGANEAFAYDPSGLVLTDDEEIEAPGLDGDIPIHVPALGSVSGVFKEDDLREASVDIERITRGNYNPFTAMLEFDKNAELIQPINADGEPEGTPIPREAFGGIIRVDVRFRANRHMVLEYTVRVRDVRGGMINELLLDAPAEELATFAPATYGG